MEGNGSAVEAVDYEQRARAAARRAWTEGDLSPSVASGRSWAVVLMGHAVVYALLEIARAIRETRHA